jgi:hypothetical protein
VYKTVGGPTNHDPNKGKMHFQLCRSNNLYGSNHEEPLVVWIKMTGKSSGCDAFQGL